MSFILDALRKSEHERQRQSGPALVETPVAAVKAKTNVWATAAIALLLVNLAAIGLVLLYKARGAPEVPVAAEATAAGAGATAPEESAESPAQASVTRTRPAPAAAAPVVPPMLRPAEYAAPGSRNSLEGEVSASSSPMDYEAARRASEPPAGPPAVVAVRPGTVVYESLPGAGPGGESGTAPQEMQRTTPNSSNLPQADEFAARAGLPEMRLELHVYSTKPAERFAFINGRKYKQGDSTQEGVTVDEITPDGVILNSRGSRFLLPRD